VAEGSLALHLGGGDLVVLGVVEAEEVLVAADVPAGRGPAGAGSAACRGRVAASARAGWLAGVGTRLGPGPAPHLVVIFLLATL
jgi:hypothetical protein